MTGRLILLATSHRVAPGLLTHAAWGALRDAERIVAPSGHPLLPALAEADLAGDRLDVLSESSGGTDVQRQSPQVLAKSLLDLAADAVVVWLVGDDGDVALAEALAPMVALRAESGQAPDIEVMHGSFDVPGARVLDLVAVMDRLRSAQGCPWDAEQTHRSLAPYLLEETYEALEAIDQDDLEALREELGDLLLQVVFHARVAEENPDRPWSIDDIAAGIVEKLVRRHPHVFGDGTATTAAEVEANWDELKAKEKTRQSPVDGVPLALPSLALATKLIDRTRRAGVDIEIAEPDLPDDLSPEQLGLILFGLASAASRRGLDPETALRQEARQFARSVAGRAGGGAPEAAS